jgi:hypothetical protein
MNDTVRRIKDLLKKGSINLGQIKAQIENNKCTIKELFEGAVFDKETLSKKDFLSDDFIDLILAAIANKELSLESVKSVMPEEKFKHLKEDIFKREQEDIKRQEDINRLESENRLKSILYDFEQNNLSKDDIKKYYEKGILSENDIRKQLKLNDGQIADILGKIVVPVEPPELPPHTSEYLLLEESTDVFTFGVPASGKSLFLGALFNYAFEKGLLRYANAHKAAQRYIAFLRENVKLGMPIGRTAEIKIKNINPSDFDEENEEQDEQKLYLSVDFINKESILVKEGGYFSSKVPRKKLHPFNFIETDGESFQDIFVADDDRKFKWFKNYLFESENKKIFFFAIDYYIDKNNKRDQIKASQSDQFINLINYLVSNKLIKETLGICLLITKWDLSENQSIEAAERFIRENYNGLYSHCKDLEKHLAFRVFPLSIGKFRPSNMYDFDLESCEDIFNWLTSVSSYKIEE